VTVTFKPTASGTRTGTLTVTSNANNSPTTVSLAGSGIGRHHQPRGRPAGLGQLVNSPYVAANLTDTDASSYWESANGSFPQWAQVDLGPELQHRPGRPEAPAVHGVAGPDGDPVRARLHGRLDLLDDRGLGRVHLRPELRQQHGHHLVRRDTARYVRVNITANTGWAAGQLSDFEVFPPSAAVAAEAGAGEAPTWP